MHSADGNETVVLIASTRGRICAGIPYKLTRVVDPLALQLHKGYIAHQFEPGNCQYSTLSDYVFVTLRQRRFTCLRRF